MKRPIAILCLVLLLIMVWLMWPAFQPKAPTKVPAAVSAPKASDAPASSPSPEKPHATRQPLKITSKGKVRLKPGQSAVLGYWEIAPGMNGMAIVTPETTPEGYVRMTTKLLQLPDATVSGLEADDLFPALFEFENFSAIDSDRLAALQGKLQGTQGVDLLSMPSVLSKPGQRVMISVGNAGDSKLAVDLQPDLVAEDGGYDLSLGLQRQE